MLMTGEYYHQIDEKGRLRIPTKLKDALGSDPVITKGSSGCLFLFPKEKADKLFESIFSADDIEDTPRTKALRELGATYTPVEVDKQGRINLPQSLLTRAGIKKNVVTIGAFDRAEIWSEERWKEYVEGGMSFDECLKTVKKEQ